VKDTTKRGKKKNLFTARRPFSLIHATRLRPTRHERSILPPALQAGTQSCWPTAGPTPPSPATRCAGCEPRLGCANLYNLRHAPPDLSLYFRVDIDTSVAADPWAAACSSSTTKPAWTSASSTDILQSFRLFQGKVLEEYDKVTEEFGLNRESTARRSVVEQQREVRASW